MIEILSPLDNVRIDKFTEIINNITGKILEHLSRTIFISKKSAVKRMNTPLGNHQNEPHNLLGS